MFKFPYDTQFCFLNFGNVLEADALVSVTWVLPEVGLGFFNPLNEFDVESHLVNKVFHAVCIAAILFSNYLSGVAIFVNTCLENGNSILKQHYWSLLRQMIYLYCWWATSHLVFIFSWLGSGHCGITFNASTYRLIKTYFPSNMHIALYAASIVFVCWLIS